MATRRALSLLPRVSAPLLSRAATVALSPAAHFPPCPLLLNKTGISVSKHEVALPPRFVGVTCTWHSYSSLPEETTVEFNGNVVPIPLAQPGEGIAECELLTWHVRLGDVVEAFQALCEVQSDKATVEITSRYSGKIVALHHQPGAMVPVGQALVDIQLAGSDAPVQPRNTGNHAHPASPASAPPPSSDNSPTGRKAESSGGRTIVPASPAARRLAKDHGLDLINVTGTGEGGHVTKGDVLAAVEAAGSHAGEKAAQEHVAGPSPGQVMAVCGDEGLVERQPLRGYARAMVKTMKAAAAVPHFYFCDELCMDALIAVRAKLRRDSAHERLTYLPFILKAASLALNDFPTINCQLSADESELLRFASHNLGVAIATPAGLVVPNIKGVQGKSIQDISEELIELQERAAAGKLTQDELSGGSLTISNIGSVGGTYAMPLLNTPESAIVALGRVRSAVQLDGSGAVCSKAVMNVSWGADHRVVDGATLAGFSNRWKSYLEDPEMLLLRLR